MLPVGYQILMMDKYLTIKYLRDISRRVMVGVSVRVRVRLRVRVRVIN